MINVELPYNDIPLLPIDQDFKTVDIFEALNKATRALGRLRGIATLSDAKLSFLVLEPLLVPESVSSNEIE
jgi:hypothetical protein